MTTMTYIGLDVHKKTISYCVKDVSGHVQQEGEVASTRRELGCWMRSLPQHWIVAMEATIFSGWIYDHLLPHARRSRWLSICGRSRCSAWIRRILIEVWRISFSQKRNEVENC